MNSRSCEGSKSFEEASTTRGRRAPQVGWSSSELVMKFFQWKIKRNRLLLTKVRYTFDIQVFKIVRVEIKSVALVHLVRLLSPPATSIKMCSEAQRLFPPDFYAAPGRVGWQGDPPSWPCASLPHNGHIRSAACSWRSCRRLRHSPTNHCKGPESFSTGKKKSRGSPKSLRQRNLLQQYITLHVWKRWKKERKKTRMILFSAKLQFYKVQTWKASPAVCVKSIKSLWETVEF